MEADKFTFEPKKDEKTTEAPVGVKDVVQYSGTLKWTEPFVTGKDQSLHLEIHAWKGKVRNYLFYCASPTDPKKGEIWKTLRKLRKSFRVETKPEAAPKETKE